MTRISGVIHGRRRAIVVATASAMLAMTACSSSSGGSGASGSATPSASAPSATSSAAASPSATLTYKPADPLGEGAWAALGKVTVHSAQEQAVVDAYLRMNQVVLQAFNTRVDDETALNSVLAGDHLNKVRTNVDWRRRQGLWTVGHAILNVLSVQINGSTATLRVCDFDATSEVGASGRNVVQPPGSTGGYVTLVQRDGVWRTSATAKDSAKCDALNL
jgi:hypothetical protein